MIENRRGLDIFSHVMLIIGVLVVLFPLYVAFVAATLDDKQVFQVPMTLIPGGHLWDNISNIWQGGVGNLKVPFSLLLLNSVIMALAITCGKIVVSVLSAYAIVYFRFPLRSLFFWLIFMTLMLPVEVRIFPHGGGDLQPQSAGQLHRSDAAVDGLGNRYLPVAPVLYDLAG
ncbi:glycerol-3-phosphate transporter membrane protein [Serratia quinivorans]|uniref:sn-glycerol-3-phosphate transport system permease protein UgpE n=1 Tax=Serratia quinivorans TaxID=137545 RepID=A0A379ZCR8_9GAMM|nr:glycerol-3-phosphate transporter membrane protein [Serratia quinivorans]